MTEQEKRIALQALEVAIEMKERELADMRFLRNTLRDQLVKCQEKTDLSCFILN